MIDNSESMGEKSRDRRLTAVDKARVAIAMNLLPLQTPIDSKMPPIPANTPKDPPRMDLVKGVLTHPELNLFKNLEKFGPLRPYTFGHDVHGLKDDNRGLAKFVLVMSFLCALFSPKGEKIFEMIPKLLEAASAMAGGR